MTTVVCANCKWWDTSEQNNPQQGRVDIGECRRNPPAITLAQLPIILQEKEFPEEAKENARDAVWPVTREWDWCGEFKQKDGER